MLLEYPKEIGFEYILTIVNGICNSVNKPHFVFTSSDPVIGQLGISFIIFLVVDAFAYQDNSERSCGCNIVVLPSTYIVNKKYEFVKSVKLDAKTITSSFMNTLDYQLNFSNKKIKYVVLYHQAIDFLDENILHLANFIREQYGDSLTSIKRCSGSIYDTNGINCVDDSDCPNNEKCSYQYIPSVY